MRVLFAVLCAITATVVACGGTVSDQTPTSTALTPSPSAAASATRSPAPMPSPVASETPAPLATATSASAGDTGIDGTVTLGPTCPVERIDSPCPDRPYAAHITIWRGDIQVAETRSGDDGRFRVILPPGTYRVVGETAGTFPHGSEVQATVVAGQMTPSRFDTTAGSADFT